MKSVNEVLFILVKTVLHMHSAAKDISKLIQTARSSTKLGE